MAAPATYFISDLHLDPARLTSSRAFFDFLHHIHGSAALYILGDLFEAWVGDDDDSELAIEVRTALRRFSDGGARLYVMHGNRDFLIGEQFCGQTGAILLPDPSVINLYGTATLLMHGDSLCTLDDDYQVFRRQSRAPDWQARMLALDLEQRRALAQQLRAQSHEAKSNKARDIVDVTTAEVERVMRANDVTRLIHGHTHRPGCYPANEGQRWVLGDWEHTPKALKVNSQECRLIDINM